MVENQTDEERSLIHLKFWQNFDSDIKELKKLKWRRSEERDEKYGQKSFSQQVFIGNQQTCLFAKSYGE